MTMPAIDVRPRERVWTVLLAYALAWASVLCIGVCQTIGAGVTVLLAQQGLEPAARQEFLRDAKGLEAALLQEAMSPGQVALGAATTASVIAIVALSAAALSKTPLTERVGLGPPRWRPGRAVWGTLAAMVAGPAFGGVTEIGLVAVAGGLSDSLQRMLQSLVDAPFPWYPVILVAAGIAAPVAEELLFRGYIQPRLVLRMGRWGGVVLTSLLFGILHMDLMHGLSAFGAGLLFGWLRERTGSIVPSIVAHASNNTIWAAMAGLGLASTPPLLSWELPVFATAALASAYALARLTVPHERPAG